MELKVWVEGIQRVVCGVCERTTCQDIVYALAHATGKTGRFTLIERWRNNERLLAPHEHPLKVLMKWGEYSSDVNFILQRTALNESPGKNGAPVVSPTSNNNKNASSRPTKTSVDPLHGFTPPNNTSTSSVSSPPSAKDLKKSLTFSGGRPGSTDSPQPIGTAPERKISVGVVRGVPQQLHHVETDQGESTPPTTRQNGMEKSPKVPPTPAQYQTTHQPVVDGHLVYPRYDPPYGRVVRQSGGPVNGSAGMETPPPPPPNHSPAQYSGHQQQHRDTPPGWGIMSGSQSPMEQNDPVRFPPPYRNPPQPSFSPGSRQPPPPPPYREPPRPSLGGLSPGYRASPTPSPGRSGTVTTSSSSTSNTPLRPSPGRQPAAPADGSPGSNFEASDDAPPHRRSSRRNLKLDLVGGVPRAPTPPSDPVHAQLIQRVNRQRGALDEQQDRLGYLEQELLVWEERLNRRLDEERQRLTSELIQLEERCRQQEDQLKDLLGVEEEWEEACREGREMTEELARMRADVSSMETRIDQCEPTLRSLRIDIAAAEERLTSQLELELSRVKADLEGAAGEERELNGQVAKVDEEVAESEGRLEGIRAQMDSLTQEIKQANLQSLSIAPADDLKLLLEGSHKAGAGGHGRRMLGSPRQLENPVPTNKNPHGVWV